MQDFRNYRDGRGSNVSQIPQIVPNRGTASSSLHMVLASVLKLRIDANAYMKVIQKGYFHSRFTGRHVPLTAYQQLMIIVSRIKIYRK